MFMLKFVVSFERKKKLDDNFLHIMIRETEI